MVDPTTAGSWWPIVLGSRARATAGTAARSSTRERNDSGGAVEQTHGAVERPRSGPTDQRGGGALRVRLHAPGAGSSCVLGRRGSTWPRRSSAQSGGSLHFDQDVVRLGERDLPVSFGVLDGLTQGLEFGYGKALWPYRELSKALGGDFVPSNSLLVLRLLKDPRGCAGRIENDAHCLGTACGDAQGNRVREARRCSLRRLPHGASLSLESAVAGVTRAARPSMDRASEMAARPNKRLELPIALASAPRINTTEGHSACAFAHRALAAHPQCWADLNALLQGCELA